MNLLGQAALSTFRLLISLRLAVVVVVSLAAECAVATCLESLYDTPTAQYWVYRAWHFRLVLFVFGLNILCVALSRWPWKPRHTPFLLAHSGILMLLAGSWVTEQWGLDGSLRIGEGERSGVVQLSESALVVAERGHAGAWSFPIRWQPPGRKFTPIDLARRGPGLPLAIDGYLPRAESEVRFEAVPPGEGSSGAAFARLRIAGGPMRISQPYSLWAGDPSWMQVQAGPARITWVPRLEDLPVKKPVEPAPPPGTPAFMGGGGPRAYLATDAQGVLRLRTFSSAGERRDFTPAAGAALDPGWKGVSLTLEEFLPRARLRPEFRPARVLFGPQAPSSAVSVNGTWMGLGDRAEVRAGGRVFDVAYQPERAMLPFAITLERFEIERYPGTQSPASYASEVRVHGAPDAPAPDYPVRISMNEPLHAGGFTFYQASYEDADPRPTVSIFSVNRDPGRPWKYGGSLLLVGGSMLLVAMRYRRRAVALPAIASGGGAPP